MDDDFSPNTCEQRPLQRNLLVRPVLWIARTEIKYEMSIQISYLLYRFLVGLLSSINRQFKRLTFPWSWLSTIQKYSESPQSDLFSLCESEQNLT